MTTPIDAKTAEQAVSTILHGVHAPAYLHRMAARGYPAKSAEDQQELLKLGWALAEQGVVRQPPAPTSRSKYASAVSAFESLTSGGVQNNEDYQRKSAAAQLAQDPAIYQSAIVLKAAEAAAKAAAQAPAEAEAEEPEAAKAAV